MSKPQLLGAVRFCWHASLRRHKPLETTRPIVGRYSSCESGWDILLVLGILSMPPLSSLNSNHMAVHVQGCTLNPLCVTASTHCICSDKVLQIFHAIHRPSPYFYVG